MIKLMKNIGYLTLVGIILLVTIFGILFPDKFNESCPFRFYSVLTNSMEPTIQTNSLVLVKSYREDMKIEKGDILTFRTERFGEPIIITHRFSHIEVNADGQRLYRTHPEGSDILDPYDIQEKDIEGVYLFHIPYFGKIILFLKSGFGFLWICEVILILLIKELIKTRWDEKAGVYS